MSRGLIAHVNGYDILTVGDACVEPEPTSASGRFWREKFLSDDQNTSAMVGDGARLDVLYLYDRCDGFG